MICFPPAPAYPVPVHERLFLYPAMAVLTNAAP
jgi:hypothetical protein